MKAEKCVRALANVEEYLGDRGRFEDGLERDLGLVDRGWEYIAVAGELDVDQENRIGGDGVYRQD